ncbi:MAG: hypothetical protein IT537_14895 [Hyphomicrobiales bacterium]|nr:hypothetical protein [Hyphomicrobiales bacterium]
MSDTPAQPVESRTRRRSRTARAASVAVSACVLTLAGLGVVVTLPMLDGDRAVTYQIDTASPLRERVRGGRLAVFAMNPDGTADRVGQARSIGRGALEVELYRDIATLEPRTTPVVLQADSRLLWEFTSDANKAKIRYLAERFVTDAQRTVRQVIGSEHFRRKYQPVLQAVARKAFDQATVDPEVREAIAALPPLQDVVDRELVTRYLAIVARNSVRNLGGMVGDLTRTIWGSGGPETPQRISGSIFNSPESRQLIADRISDLARSPEVARVAAEFGRPFVAALLTDPALVAALREIAADPTFQPSFLALEQSGLDTARMIVRLLIEGDRDDRMHALPATILRGLFLDNARWLVAFVTPDQLAALRQSKPGGMAALAAGPRDE